VQSVSDLIYREHSSSFISGNNQHQQQQSLQSIQQIIKSKEPKTVNNKTIPTRNFMIKLLPRNSLDIKMQIFLIRGELLIISSVFVFREPDNFL